MANIKQTAGNDALGEFAPEFAHLNDDVLFGEVWNRKGLSPKLRSIITVSALIGKDITDSSLKHHLAFARANGMTRPSSSPTLPSTPAGPTPGPPSGWPRRSTLRTAPSGTSTGACSDSGSSAARSKTLVVYYSAQGHTRTVAQTMADELGADLFAIDNDFTDKGPSPSAPPRRPAWAKASSCSRRPLTAESGKTASASRLAQAKTRPAPGQRRRSAKSGAIE